MAEVCSSCKSELSMDDFYLDKSKTLGRHSHCKECTKAAGKLYYSSNREKISERSCQYYANNIVSCKEVRAAYRKEHAEELAAKQREYYANNIDQRRQATRAYYEEHAKDISQQKREAHEKNPAVMMLASARKRAKRSGIMFDLKPEDIVVPTVCPILQTPITVGCREDHNLSPSLDRINPDLGYVSGNIAVVSYRANRLKNNGSAQEHRQIADWMSDWIKTPRCAFVNLGAGKREQKLVSKARERARTRHLPFFLKKSDITIPELCPVLRIPLQNGNGKLHDNSPTLDRFVEELGYVPDNVSVVSYRANRMKNDGTAEEHRKIADWMDKMLGVSENSD